MLLNNFYLVDDDIKDKKEIKINFLLRFFFKYIGIFMFLNLWEKNKLFREKGKCILNMKNNYYCVFGVKNVVVLCI